MSSYLTQQSIPAILSSQIFHIPVIRLSLDMISTRGEAYAKAGLANGYLNPPKALFDGGANKDGVVSFGNAENVIQSTILHEVHV